MVKKVTESRETEDQLIRDMLEATASIINCVGGVNGDNPKFYCGVIKSSLIDSKLLTDNAEDNEGQADLCLAA